MKGTVPGCRGCRGAGGRGGASRSIVQWAVHRPVPAISNNTAKPPRPPAPWHPGPRDLAHKLLTPHPRRHKPSICCRPASIREQDRSSHEAGRVRYEKHGRSGHLVGAGPSAEDALVGVGLIPVGILLDWRGQRRLDDAGGDCVDANAGWSELGGRRSDELDDTGLGGGVDALAWLDDLGAYG